MEDYSTKSRYSDSEADQSLAWKCVRITCGAFIGGILSFVVNSALVEISLNPFFSFYIAFLLFFVGTAILFRVQRHRESPRRHLLTVFAVMVLTAGFLCLFFHRQWMFKLSRTARGPLYALIGCALCFSIAFSTLDLINFSGTACQPGESPLIDSVDQINLLLGTSIVMGIGFGLAFGIIGVGLNVLTSEELTHQFAVELLFCIPFGLLIGATSAILNEYLRNRREKGDEYKYSPLFQDDTVI